MLINFLPSLGYLFDSHFDDLSIKGKLMIGPADKIT